MSRMVERSGVLVVRAWIEGACPSGLRARITQAREVTSAQQIEMTAATIDQVLAIVREWLQSLMEPENSG